MNSFRLLVILFLSLYSFSVAAEKRTKPMSWRYNGYTSHAAAAQAQFDAIQAQIKIIWEPEDYLSDLILLKCDDLTINGNGHCWQSYVYHTHYADGTPLPTRKAESRTWSYAYCGPRPDENGIFWNNGPDFEYCQTGYDAYTAKVKTQSCSEHSNPCNPVTGNKTQTEVDYRSNEPGFELLRSYNSLGSSQSVNQFAYGWAHNYADMLDRLERMDSQHDLTADGETAPDVTPFVTLIHSPMAQISDNAANNTSEEYSTKNSACLTGYPELWRLNNNLPEPTPVVGPGRNKLVYENDVCKVVDDEGKTLLIVDISKVGQFAEYHSAAGISLNDLNSTYAQTYHDYKGGTVDFEGGQPILAKGGYKIVSNADGSHRVVHFPNGSQRHFNKKGQMLRIVSKEGRSTQLDYALSVDDGGDGNDESLDKVTSPSGRTMTFHYTTNDERMRAYLTKVTTPDGDISYEYDDAEDLIKVTYPDGSSKGYTYDDKHKLTSIVDEKGVEYSKWTYHDDGRAASSEHAGGVDKATFSYNSDGTSTATGALGNVTTYHSGIVNGRIVNTHLSGDRCVNCNAGDVKEKSYDDKGNMTSSTDWQGNVTTYTYNERDLISSVTEASGTDDAVTTYYEWHPDHALITTIKKGLTFITLTYNTQLQMTAREERGLAGMIDYRTTSYTYVTDEGPSFGKIATVDGPRDDVEDITTYTYDDEGNLATITNALGHVITLSAYDGSGRVTEMSDANDALSQLVWDKRGRLLSIETAGVKTSLSYDLAGQLTQVTQADGAFIKNSYDDAQRLIKVTDNSGNSVAYSLDKAGNRIATQYSDAAQSVKYSQQQVFDKISQLIKVLGDNQQQTTLSYNSNRQVVGVEDALTRSSTREYNGLNQLVKHIDALSGDTVYEYDALGNLNKVTDAEGLSTEYQYNAFAYKTKQISPDTGVSSYSYDAQGNRKAHTDARGINVNYTYDALNRLTGIQYPDPNLDISYSYDEGDNGIGRLSSVTTQSSTETYQYNSLGKRINTIITYHSGQNYELSYTYNEHGQKTSMIYPSGVAVMYEYDENGKISAMRLNDEGTEQTLIEGITRLPFGPVNSFVYGNGIEYSASYDSSYRITSILLDDDEVGSYGYNAVDNIIDLSRNGVEESFAYDHVDRLLNASGGSYSSMVYSYDKVGNRESKSVNGSDNTYSYDENAHQLVSISGAAQNQQNSFDDAGNLISDGRYAYEYNDAGRLAKVKRNGAIVAEYHYNARGLRTQKIIHSNTANSDALWLQISKGSQYLQLAEVEVLNAAGENIIETATAKQSSDYGSAVAARAVDGNSSGSWGSSSIAHTAAGDASPYWRVQLKSGEKIASINIANRTDCCTDRMQGVSVTIANSEAGLSSGNAATHQINSAANSYALSAADFSNAADYFVQDSTEQGTWLQVSKGSQYLQLAEVEVLNAAGENIIEASTAKQSSNYGSAVAARAVDGNISGSWGSSSIAHTAAGDASPYWRVQLKSSEKIASINIANRTDCCTDRMQGVSVTIANSEADLSSGNAATHQINSAANSYALSAADFSNAAAYFEQNTWLQVSKGSQYLQLAEVEVLNAAGENIIEASTAKQSSNYGSAVAARAVDGNSSGSWGSNSIAHTAAGDASPYWRVQLKSGEKIASINIANRTDCCTDRMQGVSVTIANSEDGLSSGNAATHQINSAANSYALSAADFSNAADYFVQDSTEQGTWLQVSKGSQYLQLAEVEVLNAAGENIIEAASAKQSSNYGSAVAARAVDGNSSGSWGSSSIAHTAAGDASPFWRVQLKSGEKIASINIANRTDCCKNRMQGVSVTIANSEADLSGSDAATHQINSVANSYTLSAVDFSNAQAYFESQGGATTTTVTHYLYDEQGLLIQETTLGAADSKEYVYFNGQPLAMLEGDEVYYYHNDHLGTPIEMTADNQDTVWQATRTPFGETEVKVAEIENNIRFPGQYFDAETNLHYNWNRYYDPSTGRYITSDPIGLEGGINTYGYVGGNPLSFVDPDGLLPDGVYTPWGLKNWGEEEAEEQYDPSNDNKDGHPNNAGKRDSYRHCITSCEAAKSYGNNGSIYLGDMNELQAELRGNQTDRDRNMDEWNNACGIGVKNRGEDCKAGCQSLLNNGVLDTDKP